MRTLILGAGGTGGYFGARLLESGADVTFLVRPGRAELLKQHGLIVRSQFGDFQSKELSLCNKAESEFDLIVLSCKAYDLESSMDAIAGAVGSGTTILPILNGMAHFEKLQDRFGSEKILGGLCIISSTIGESGEIRHLNDTHTLKYGEFNGGLSERVKNIDAMFKRANFVSIASERISQDIWEKWVMISSLAALTTLMRGNIGQVVSSPGGSAFGENLLAECFAVLKANGQELRQAFVESNHARLKDEQSTLAASMLRDMESGGRVEADQIIGDLIKRAEAKQIETPNLQIAYCNLKVYELKRGSNL